MCAPASTAAVTAAAVGQSRSVADISLAKRARQEAFAGWPHDEGPAEIAELAEPAEHLVAVHGLLGEAKTGIDQHGVLRDAGAGGKGDALAQLVEHLVDDLVVDRLLVHVLRPPARVHQDDRSAAVLATTCARSGSYLSPLMSFTIDAPASSAASAIEAL